MSILKSFDIVVVADSYQASHYWGKRKFTGFKYSHNELLQGDQELYRVTCSTDKRNYFTDKPITSLFSASDLDHPLCLYTSGKFLDRDEVLRAGSRRPQRLKARHIDCQYEIKSGSDNVWVGFNWQGIRFYWEQCDGKLDEAITRGVKQWPFGHKEYKHPELTPSRHTRYDRDAHYKLVPIDTPNIAYAVYISKETNLVSTDTWHVGELDSKKRGMQKRKGLGRIDFFAPMGPELEQLSLIVLFGWLKHMAELFASQGGGSGGGGGAVSGGGGGGGGGCGGGGGGGCGGGGGGCGG